MNSNQYRPVNTKAFSGMRMCLNNMAQAKRHDIQWEDSSAGPENRKTWISTVFINGKAQANGYGSTIDGARDMAAYLALTTVYIPPLFPSTTYPYLNMTKQLHDELARVGRSHELQWEPERKQGKDFVAQILINGEPLGMGIGPTVLCARDMASSYALGAIHSTYY